MKNKLIWTTGISFGILMAVGFLGLWYLSRSEPQPSNQASTAQSVESSESSQTQSDSSSLLLSTAEANAPSVSQGVPMGTSQTSNSPVQAQSIGGTTTPSSSNSGGSTATLDPAEFETYDKYKSAESGMYADIKQGTGTVAVAGKTASVIYRGWLTNGNIFDQNMDEAKPYSFALGSGQVIPGWDQTVVGMKVGGERLLIVPPGVGYGSTARPGIPANSVLVFYVKLISVK